MEELSQGPYDQRPAVEGALACRFVRWTLDPRRRYAWARALRGRPPLSAWLAAGLYDALLASAARSLELSTALRGNDELVAECEAALAELVCCLDQAAESLRSEHDSCMVAEVGASVMWLRCACDAVYRSEADRHQAVAEVFSERLRREGMFLGELAAQWARPFLRPAPVRWVTRGRERVNPASWRSQRLRLAVQRAMLEADSQRP